MDENLLINLIRSQLKRRRKWLLRAPTTALHVSFALVFTVAHPLMISSVAAQCPNGTMTSFERIGGVEIKNVELVKLYSAPNTSAYAYHPRPSYGGLEFGGGSGGAQQQVITPITAECNNRCRRSSKCRAFIVNYAQHTCWSVEQPAHLAQLSASPTGLIRMPPPIHLVASQERTSYFEKVCLSLPAIECERAWVYERVMGHHLHGYDDKIIDDVPSRPKCQEHCLNEQEFRCRSGEYDSLTMQCRLSMVDRHLKPAAFRPTAANVDYFENQCVPVGNQCDAFDQHADMDLGRAEIMRSANTSDQCQQICTQTIKAFICRSFTWNPLTGKCYLNSANSFMVGGADRLIRAPGLVYYQRNDCIDLKLECDTTAMTLNLRTNEPFQGRMYVRDDPNGCETMGRSSLTSSLSIPFQSHSARCAVREPPNRFSSIVVVQQHPLIQRKADRYIKVVCDFQTANKTITSSYNVVNNPWTSTALINATSFAPKIKLRITDKYGIDISGAKLGDELYLRIEAETESVYDMVARSVLAKSGITDESIMLIDKDGCPTDWRIFPSLKKLNRRTIIGKFDAFKFSSDVVVRFQVDVQFCLNQCPSTSCDSSNLLLNSQQLTGGPDAFESTVPMQQTTSSPSALSSSSGAHDNNDSSIASAYGGSSSTQAPAQVPYQQRTSISAAQQQQTPAPGTHLLAGNGHERDRANYSSMSNQQQLHKQTSGDAGSYYYQPNQAAAPHSSLMGRHPSQPANSPQHQAGTGGPSIADQLLAPTSDPQMFEQAQPRSAPMQPVAAQADQAATVAMKSMSGDQSAGSKGRVKQQQLAANSIISDAQSQSQVVSESGNPGSSALSDMSSVSTSANLAEQQQQQQDAGSSNRLRRRRRSAEPMPRAPSHVPLQREIIVESTSTSSSQAGGGSQPNKQFGQRGQQQQQLSHRGAKSTSGGQHSARKIAKAAADGLNRNGPAYDLNGNKQEPPLEQQEQQQQADNGSPLLCTTKYSLVIASIAFCTVQLFTIALCFATWMHRRGDTKRFKEGNAKELTCGCNHHEDV